MILATLVCLGTASGALPGGKKMKAIMDDADLGSKKMLVAALHVISSGGIGGAIMYATVFDAILNAMDWLGAARKAIHNFAAETHAVATANQDVADIDIGRIVMAGAFVPVPLVQEAGGKGDALDIASMTSGGAPAPVPVADVDLDHPRLRFLRRQRAARARLERAFATAWDLMLCCNRIFAPCELCQPC